MDQEEIKFDFDFFVIGGGSGGLAAAKAAGKYGARVGLADFVKPSPLGSTWGLGGTCVNVGCIPKKLMHFTSLMGEMREDQIEAGWTGINHESSHDWLKMVNNVQSHIKKLNWGYKVALVDNGVVYKNKFAQLVDRHTIQLTDAKGKIEIVKSRYILVAVGGRPTLPPASIPNGDKLVLTSDDIFQLKRSPGKTLVVGASYVALECAGFLSGMKYDTTVMVRSILLRGFDQEIAEKIGEYMINKGTKFIRGCVPDNIEATEDGRRRVTWNLEGQLYNDVFDTVLYAIGRYADTKKLNLEQVGVILNKDGKIICNEDDSTSIDNIFALGDVVQGRPELTPTAIKCGQLLSSRLFNGGKTLMDYSNVATTVFTPLEYGCIGLSEEQAKLEYGEEDIKVYQSIFKPLEWNFLESHEAEICFAKVIVYEVNRRVVGLHYLGPNAGEVTQGYAVAMKMGMTKDQLDSTVGIHPTTSEEIVQLNAIKGIDDAVKGGC